MSDKGARRLLLTLTALNVLGYVDRQLVAALGPVLMADLGLSRTDIGLLIGPVFIVVFAFGTLLLGRVADSRSRPRVIAAGLAAWSAATALTGTASGFASMVLWRGLVGIGEATLPPTALSMLGDKCAPSRLGFAAGVYYAGIPIGFGCSLALSGWIVPRFGWRICFYVLGAAGLAAVAFVWRVTDPPRRCCPAAVAPLATVLRQALTGRGSLVLLVAGATLLAYASASAQHLVTWLVLERGFAYSRAAYQASAVVLGAGLLGSLAIGALTDAAQRRRSAGRLAALVGLGSVSLAASAVFFTSPSSSPLFLVAWIVAQAWSLGWFGPVMAAVHDLAPAESRGAVLGFALMVVNLGGVATGPWITGAIGDRASLTAGLLVSVAVGVVGLGLLAVVALRGGRETRP